MLRKLFKNKIFIYLGTRYGTYAIQFITSLIIAGKLGPFYFGIYGFVILIINYFQQLHFGISNSFNVLYVQNRNNDYECNNYIWNSILLVSYLSILVLCFWLYNTFVGIDSVTKYNADKYILWICAIAILEYFLQFFINLLRVKNKLNHVAFCQSIVVIFNFICVFLFSGETLIISILAGYVIGDLLCVLITIQAGVIPRFSDSIINREYHKRILKKGIFLFFYNSCFYFIIISIRTIISENYNVDEFGLFSFAFTSSHAILLLLSSLSFVVLPKVIGKLASNDMNEVESTINVLRTSYITSAHLLIYLALCFFPLLLYILPKYEESLTALNLIALTVLMSTNSYSYVELLTARNKEKLLALLSFVSLVGNCAIALFLVNLIKVNYSYVILSTMFVYFLFTFMVLKAAKKKIGVPTKKYMILELMPVRLMLPYMTAFVVSVLRLENIIWLPLIVFIIMNWKTKDKLVDIVKTLINQPSVVNL